MKRIICLICCFFIIFSITSCKDRETNNEDFNESSNLIVEDSSGEETDMLEVDIVVNKKEFTAKLKNNETTQRLISKFPLTIKMKELNNSEKYYRFNDNISTTKGEKPKVINAGEIMVYSGSTLVVFYETFSNNYEGYDPIGKIDDITELKNKLGTGDADVTFSLAQ